VGVGAEADMNMEDWYDPTMGEQHHLTDTTFLYPNPCGPCRGRLHY